MSIPQLSRLLPLPEEELKQVIDYASTLSKQEAVEHFGNLLGDSPDVVDFISSFNSRRQDPKAPSYSSSAAQPDPSGTPASSGAAGVPKQPRGGKKKKNAPLRTPAPRPVTNLGPTPGTAYNKKDTDNEYVIGRPNASSQQASRAASPAKPPAKLPPSAAGHLISGAAAKPKAKPSPAPAAASSAGTSKKTKVQVTGGTAMRGASTTVSDLDAAIRALELTTNPTKGNDDAERRCNCVAARHPLLAAAPNCLRCGKVVCVKEGLGPCTFCGAPLLRPDEVAAMLQELKAERGQERMAADRAAHKRADVSRAPAAFARARENNTDEAEARALENRDRLLGFQAQNARRTTVRDEAADFDVGTGGPSMWASPEERARELKRQQKLLREMEWNAKPDYEKRQTVVSIDLVKGRVVRKMAAVARPSSPVQQEEEVVGDVGGEDDEGAAAGRASGGGGGGTFSRNPLLGGLIKPVFDAKGKGAALAGRKDGQTRWRRVQDDQENNEDIILDGGAYGGKETGSSDEPGCG